MTHHCHAEGCTVTVPPEMLMCRRHWFMVPHELRRAVWKAYQQGQCDRKNPSDAWCRAADAAVAAVAAQEGVVVRGTFLQAFFPGMAPSVAAIVLALALAGCAGARGRFCWNEKKDDLVVRTCCQDKRDLGMASWIPDGPVTCTPVRIEKEPPCR